MPTQKVNSLNVEFVQMFFVTCEACAMAACGPCESYEAAERIAQQKGFVGVLTEEDGVINYCARCTPSIVEQLKESK